MNKNLLLSLVFAAIASPAFAALTSVPAVNLYGTANVNGSNALVRLSGCGGDFTVIRKSENFSATGGGTLVNNELFLFSNYNHNWMNDYTYQYTSTLKKGKWTAPEYLTGSLEATARSLATDPRTCIIYGCLGRSLPYTFARFDSSSPSDILIIKENVTSPYNAMGFSADGTLYAICADGRLVKVSTADGTETLVGDTGLAGGEYASGTIDAASDVFFYVYAKGHEKTLYAIDLTDAKAQQVAYVPFSTDFLGMFALQPTAIAEKAPSYVTDISDASSEDLTATVTFRMPTVAFDGTPLSGNLSYKVSEGATVLKEGTAAAGAEVSLSLTRAEAGTAELTFSASDSDGEGPVSNKAIFFGRQAPMPVRDAAVTREGNLCTVTWTAPSLTVHGHTIAPEALKYKVTRQPDNVVVAEALTSTVFTEDYPEPNHPIRLYYEVEALNAEAASQKTLTPEVACGQIVPPYIRDFDDYMVGLGDMTVIDNNHDGYSWYWMPSAAWMQHSYGPKDDYLITEPIRLEGGKSYQLTFTVGVKLPEYTDRIEVKFGTAPTVEGLSQTILEPVDVNTVLSEKRKLTASVTPEADGLYYIGFHSCAEYGHQLIVDDIEFIAPISTAAPAAPEAFAVVPDAGQYNKAVFTLKAPASDTDGKPLQSIDRIELKGGETLLHTWTAPEPGAELTAEVDVPASGQWSFSVVAYNENGIGMQAYTNDYIGVKRPTVPTAVTFRETENDGEVLISWECPAKDVDGRDINPDLVFYTVTDASERVIADDLKETSLTYRAVPANIHAQVCFFVTAKTEMGKAASAVQTPIGAIGKAYTTPYEESFDGDSAPGWALTTNAPGYCMWSMWDYVKVNNVQVYPYDEDNGLLYATAVVEGLECAARTGKISLAGLEKPAFAFSFWANSNGYDELTLFILSNGEVRNLEVIQSKDFVGENGEGWVRKVYPLTEWAGGNIQVGFNALAWSTLQPIVIDKISVGEESQLALGAITPDAGLPVVTAHDGVITISGAAGAEVTVTDAAGRVIRSVAQAPDMLIIAAAPGMYIVKAGETAVKVMLR